MTRAVQAATCALCGDEFEATVRFALVSRYCSDTCRNEANRQTMVVRGIAIEPSEKKPIRKEPMTNVEMEAELKKIERQRTRDNLPLVNLEMMACREKAAREAEAARTDGGQNNA